MNAKYKQKTLILWPPKQYNCTRNSITMKFICCKTKIKTFFIGVASLHILFDGDKNFTQLMIIIPSIDVNCDYTFYLYFIFNLKSDHFTCWMVSIIFIGETFFSKYRKQFNFFHRFITNLINLYVRTQNKINKKLFHLDV